MVYVYENSSRLLKTDLICTIDNPRNPQDTNRRIPPAEKTAGHRDGRITLLRDISRCACLDSAQRDEEIRTSYW